MMLISAPKEFNTILDRVKERNWIISWFDSNCDAIYNPAQYCYNRLNIGINYKLVVDRNIFQYIIQSERKAAPRTEYKDAVALVAFCQIAEIEIEPNLAIYEKINYLRQNVDEVIEELQCFYNIDNSQTGNLMKYVLGESSRLETSVDKEFDKEKLKMQLTQYERLEEWDSLYLLILKLITICEEKSDNMAKFERLINWMVTDFRLSNIIIVYVIVLLFKPLSGMIKYKAEDSRDKKQQAIRNMTWDIYFMNRAFRLWQSAHDNERFLFASNDNVIRDVLPLAIEINNKASWKPIEKFVSQTKYKLIEAAFGIIGTANNRVYGTESWTREHRQRLISELESMLL